MAQPARKLAELGPALRASGRPGRGSPPGRARAGPTSRSSSSFSPSSWSSGASSARTTWCGCRRCCCPGWRRRGSSSSSCLPRLRRLWRDEPGARAEAKTMALGTVRDWLPLVLVAPVFDNLEDYTGIIRKVPIDAWLYRSTSRSSASSRPSGSQRLYHPLLTDWMALCYGVFFIVPMILGIALCLRGRGARLPRDGDGGDAADVDRLLPVHLLPRRPAALLRAFAPRGCSPRTSRRSSASTTTCRGRGTPTIRCWCARPSRRCTARTGS